MFEAAEMFKAQRSLAHIGLGLVISGLVVHAFYPKAYLVSFVAWLLAFFFGIWTFIKNKRIFPTKEQMLGADHIGLDLIGYIEAYLSILPAIMAIILIVFIALLR